MVDQPDRSYGWIVQTALGATPALSILGLLLAGIAAAAFSLLGALLSANAFRGGQRWAWGAMWLFPLVLAGYAAVFLNRQVTSLAAYCGALAAISALVLLLSIRRFRRTT